jgi:hypothetical protein
MALYSANSVYAGGNDWPVKVISVVTNYETKISVVTVSPVQPGVPFSCAEQKIFIKYEWPVFSHKPVTDIENWETIGYLKKSSIKQEVINLGSMGEGWLKDENDPCSIHSRALKVMENNYVYSFYKWP